MRLVSRPRRASSLIGLLGMAVVATACPADPDPKVPTPEFLAGLKVCGECASQPNAGWCGPTTGTAGRCMAADEASGRPKPADCREDWFTMASDPDEPDPPYCPALTLDPKDPGGAHTGEAK